MLVRIRGIQNKQQLNFSQYLADLEAQLLSEYEMILSQEKDLWYMKSRINHIIWNDMNTKFLQASTIQRRKRNRIHFLRNQAGDWINDHNQLRDQIYVFYQNLFSTDMICSFIEPDEFPTMRRILNPDTKLLLDKVPSPMEIDQAIADLKPFKAPGPDGLPPTFFQFFGVRLRRPFTNWSKKSLSYLICLKVLKILFSVLFQKVATQRPSVNLGPLVFAISPTRYCPRF